MTGNTLIDLAISISGVILLVGLARFVFGERKVAFDEATLAKRLAFDEPDFEPIDWLIGSAGAIAINDKGEAALIKPLGDDLVTRRLRRQDLHISRENSTLIVQGPDHTFSGMAVAAADETEAQLWLVRLKDAS